MTFGVNERKVQVLAVNECCRQWARLKFTQPFHLWVKTWPELLLAE